LAFTSVERNYVEEAMFMKDDVLPIDCLPSAWVHARAADVDAAVIKDQQTEENEGAEFLIRFSQPNY